MREALQEIHPYKLVKTSLEERLEWLKSRFGLINHVFTESRPRSHRMSAKIYFCNVTSITEGFEVEFSINERVRQIRSKIGDRLRANL
jgi:hypothetical protein